MYILRVDNEGYVKFSSCQGNVEFTDNWYLFKSFYSIKVANLFVNTVLAGYKVTILKIDEV